jgi:hypothetical protein
MDDQSPSATRAIEIRIEDISQLFHSLDPFPFRERDLDDDAEEFIVSWAREIPADQPLKIIVPLPDTQASRQEAKELGAAMTRYFNYRAHIVTLDLKELFRVGAERWPLAPRCSRSPPHFLHVNMLKPAG